MWKTKKNYRPRVKIVTRHVESNRKSGETIYIILYNDINHYAGIPKIKEGTLLSLDVQYI